MSEHVPPQPHPDRLTDFARHPIVVGVVPDQPPLVALTAASMALATGAPALHFAYVDPSRYTVQEHPDGSVQHAPVDPDTDDRDWTHVDEQLTAQLQASMTDQSVPWRLHYLAGRVDRSLTHLARAVDAAAFVIGAHTSRHRHIPDFMHHDIGVQLSHRQHRPVLVVPLRVVDWKGRAPWE